MTLYILARPMSESHGSAKAHKKCDLTKRENRPLYESYYLYYYVSYTAWRRRRAVLSVPPWYLFCRRHV